jgi:uncharacterized membrane protein
MPARTGGIQGTPFSGTPFSGSASSGIASSGIASSGIASSGTRLQVRAGLVLTGVGSWLLAHVATNAGALWLVDAVVAAQVTVIVWLLAAQLAARYRTMLAAAALAGMTVAMIRLGLPARSVGLAMAGVCHAAAYVALLTWFGLSLRSGREPIVTRLARRIRRTMPDRVVRYTRHVTIAWCLFFAAQLGVSAGLLIAARLPVWASFVSVWNVPLIAGMILAEFACRSILLRREQRTGLIATLAGMRHISGAP